MTVQRAKCFGNGGLSSWGATGIAASISTQESNTTRLIISSFPLILLASPCKWSALWLLGSDPAGIVFLAWSNAEAFVGKTPPQEKTDNSTQQANS
jgi:hypothetical protein